MQDSALENRVLVRFAIAFLLANMAEWAFFVGALVYAFDNGGSRAAGFASVALLLPTAIAAPASGSAPRRHHPARVRLLAYLTQSVALSAAAVAAFAGATVPVVVGCCAVAAAAFTFLGPACAVLVPAIVRSARELTVANLWIGSCEGISTLAGSLLATALLAAEGPALALAGGAALTLTSAIITVPHDRRDATPWPESCSDADAGPDERVGSTRLIFRSVAALRTRPGAGGVLAVAGGQYLLVGSLDLIVVVLATDSLGLDNAGPGILITSFGIGAVLSSISSAKLVKRRRLAPLLGCALAGIAASSFLLGITPTLVTALFLLAIVGFSRALLDLTSRMLLQRATPAEALAPVFGAIELFAGVGMVIGSLAAQLLIAARGVDAALFGIAAFFAFLLVLTWSSLRVADDSADIPVVAISLLRHLSTFAPLPPLSLETVARAATEVRTSTGQIVMTEGDEGDTFYAVADGSFDIVTGGRLVCTAERGGSFGEVALLANVPRTATITATRPGSLLAIQRVPFLVAVTGTDSSREAAWGVIRSMGLDIDRDGADPPTLAT